MAYRNCIILIVISCAVSICTAQEFSLIHRSSWPPVEYSEDGFGTKYLDFAPTLNPEQTNEYETSTLEDMDAIDDQCTLYKAKLTQKELYFQYIRYKVDVPDLKEFTLCIWMRAENLSNDHTIFSYAVDGQPQEIRSWLSNTDRSSYFNLAVGGSDGKQGDDGSVHLFSINYPFRRRRWYHTCQSWSGITGNWLVYVEGERIGAGNSPRTIGRVMRGGGVPVTGQTQHQTGGGFVEEGGIEGEVTLFTLWPEGLPTPLHEADFEGRRLYHTSCDGLCKAAPAFHPRLFRQSRLTSQAREKLALSPERPIHVQERPPSSQQSSQLYYSVREEHDRSDYEQPMVTFRPAANGIRRHIVFQTNPVNDGGVQLFVSGRGRAARSVDHCLLDFLPHAHVSANYVFDSKRLDSHDSFVPNFDFPHHQSDFHLFPTIPNFGQYGEHYDFGRGGISKSRGTQEEGRMDRRIETAIGAGKEERRVYKVEGGVPEIMAEGTRMPAKYGEVEREMKAVIDWRTTPKKLYAGSMWLRANPVCRKF